MPGKAVEADMDVRERRAWVPAMLPVMVLAFAAATAGAQTHAAAAAKSRAAKTDSTSHAAALSELDAWLRRLTGRFRLSAFAGTLEGVADCAGIGEGPGVHCIYRMGPARRADQWIVNVRLFGIDPDAPGVRLLQLNEQSTAEVGLARLQGNAITFRDECPVVQPPSNGAVSVTVSSCRREQRIHAAPDGRSLRLRIRTTQRVTLSTPGGRSRPTEMTSEIEWLMERLPAEKVERR